jgi:hypothetical protein
MVGDEPTTVLYPGANQMPIAPYEIIISPSQQEMIDHALGQGWMLDTTKTVNTFRGFGWGNLTDEEKASYLVQHPFSFTCRGKDGGIQTLVLSYPTDYGLFGKALRSASFEWNIPGTNRVRRVCIQAPRSYHGPDFVWNVLAVCGEKTTIRQRVAAFISSPEAIIAKAAGAKEDHEQAAYAAARRREADREARNNIPAGWLTLQAAAQAVVASDGLSDHTTLLEALGAAMGAVKVSAPVV